MKERKKERKKPRKERQTIATAIENKTDDIQYDGKDALERIVRHRPHVLITAIPSENVISENLS